MRPSWGNNSKPITHPSSRQRHPTPLAAVCMNVTLMKYPNGGRIKTVISCLLLVGLTWYTGIQQSSDMITAIHNRATSIQSAWFEAKMEPALLHLPIKQNNETAMTAFYHNVHWMQQQIQSYSASSRNAITLNYHGVKELSVITQPWFKNKNLFCSTVQQQRTKQQDSNRFIIVNITFGCRDIFKNGYLGTGNYLAFFYGLQLSAHVLGNIDLHLACHDAEATQRELILPWTMGYFPGRLSHEPSRYPVSNESACSGFRDLPLSYMYREIQHDLRRMAIALVGIPSPSPPVSPNEVRRRHASASYAQQHVWPLYNTTTNQYYYHRPIGSSVLLLPPPKQSDQPMYETPSEFQMDDVTIHFRCGDFLSDQWDFIETSTFSSYVEPITPNIRSIGILTQSLEVQNAASGRQQRIDDIEKTVVRRCKTLVYSFVAYVQHFHPHVEIRIHNSINETIALTYARMIMARQSSITGMTSFGEFATMATFGTGYIRSPGQWIRPIDELNETVIWYPAEKIASFQYIKQLWMVNGTQAALQWFWNGVIPRDGNYCGILHRSICQ